MNFLITGATGDVGSKVVELLLQRGERPRIFVRDEQRARSIFHDRVDIFVGDLAEPASLLPALQGVDALYLVNTGPKIPQRDKAAVLLAKSARVKRLVKLSSMDVRHGLAIGAWHELGEAAIRSTQVPFTFIQPTGFMSNLLAWKDSIKGGGIVRSSTGDGRRPFIHSQDIAAVSVEALISDKYLGESLPITGPEALTFGDATDQIGEAIGKALVYQPISDQEARERYSKVSGSTEETEAHVALWKAIREGRLAATTGCFERVVGRKPTAMRQWVRENAAAFCD